MKKIIIRVLWFFRGVKVSLCNYGNTFLQAFHKSHLLKLRVAPSETAMTDVLREVFPLSLFYPSL